MQNFDKNLRILHSIFQFTDILRNFPNFFRYFLSGNSSLKLSMFADILRHFAIFLRNFCTWKLFIAPQHVRRYFAIFRNFFADFFARWKLFNAAQHVRQYFADIEKLAILRDKNCAGERIHQLPTVLEKLKGLVIQIP